MPTIVNPIDAFKTFEPALKRGELDIQRGEIDPELLVHLDFPNGETRITYARMQGSSVTAIAIISPAGFDGGLPVFQIGYAVPQHLRKRGIAKALTKAAIEEFTAGMARSGIVHFYLEAIVGVRNVASQKVACHIFSNPPTEVTDHNSGEAALKYISEIGSGENHQPS